jgi:hypothetical protein
MNSHADTLGVNLALENENNGKLENHDRGR